MPLPNDPRYRRPDRPRRRKHSRLTEQRRIPARCPCWCSPA
jgi:hypothetical protein